MTGGARHSYGHLPFALDGRAASGVRSADGKRSIVGVRMLDNPRFGLIVLEPGRLRTIGGAFSLNDCDFTISLSKGACIAQSQTQPPAIAEIDVDRKSTRLNSSH